MPHATPTPPTSKTSALYIEPLKKEDVAAYQNVRHLGFASNINHILYSREPSAETHQQMHDKVVKNIEDGVLYMACKEKETGKMIAGAQWRYVGPKNPSASETNGTTNGGAPLRSWEEVEADLKLPDVYPETNAAAQNALFSVFNENKRKIMENRPYMVLDILATHPDHHRRGAGGLLVQWGCDQADERNVEAYLEGSLMGVPMYARYGFEGVTKVGVSEGLEAREEFILMRRPARWEREQK